MALSNYELQIEITGLSQVISIYWVEGESC
jgi:hypothetical protein